MDTEEKYLDADFYVVMAGELPPDDIVASMEKHATERIKEEDSHMVGWEGPNPSRDHVPIGEKPKVDGWVNFYWPDKIGTGEAYKIGGIPFRSVNKDGLWFAQPDNEKGSKRPVWKWQNPDEDPHESLTLKPSIGLFGDKRFHCFITDGKIDWR